MENALPEGIRVLPCRESIIEYCGGAIGGRISTGPLLRAVPDGLFRRHRQSCYDRGFEIQYGVHVASGKFGATLVMDWRYMDTQQRLLLSGNEAIAYGALDAGVRMGVGYPGTPSTEILETFSELGGHGQWAPNEKVALELAIGASMGGGRSIATMKHVGVNVAADPLFTAAYMGVDTGLVLVSADDPGMASSQNEQDNRRYGPAAGVPILEPADSQEAYDLTILALELSEQFNLPVMLRVTTRICHSKTLVQRRTVQQPPEPGPFVKDIPRRVMIPAFAKPAHRRLRKKLAELANWGEQCNLAVEHSRSRSLGIVTSGISTVHAREADPQASVLQLKLTYPLPLARIQQFVDSVDRCVVLEEGDPILLEALRSAGMTEVEGKDEMYRFGELNVARVQRILAGDTTPELPPQKGRPPQLCVGCPHRKSYELLQKQNCIVPGDIGCYSLGTLPPFSAMDTLLCMGAGITVGLGLRWTLPEDEARRVVSVIGDSTFMHSGLTGIAEMVYNCPPTGHVVMILDNSITAMTGMQEHPGTGRLLDHTPAPGAVSFEDTCRAMGVQNVWVVDPVDETKRLESLLLEALSNGKTNVLIVRRPCILAVKKIRAAELKAQKGSV